VVASIPEDHKLTVTAFRDDRWCRVTLASGKSGWVKEEYLQFTAPQGSSSSTSSGDVKAAWVDPEVANLRKSPDLGADCITQLKRGTKVYVVARDGSWRKVKTEGGTWGWLRSDLLEFDVDRGRKLSAANDADEPAPAWINGNVVNMRGGPSTGYSTVDQVTKGTKVYVVARSGQWAKCKGPNGYGWVLAELLETNVAQGRRLAGEGSSAGDKAYCLGSAVWLREGPSTSANEVGQVRMGDTLWVKEEKGSWVRVTTLSGRSGWIAGWYVRRHGANTTIAKAPDADNKPRSVPAPAEMPDEGQIKPFRAWIADDGTNVRTGASTDKDVKFTLAKFTPVTVVDVQGQWCKVRTASGNEGWAAGWVLDFQPPGEAEATKVVDGERVEAKAGWVNRPSVNIRKDAGMDKSVVTQAPLGTEVVIIDQKSGWFKVALGDGTMGWVDQDLIKTRAEQAAAASDSSDTGSSDSQPPAVTSGSGSGRDVVREAMRHLGKAYVGGGDGPDSFDCSGFTSYVYRQFGVNLARTTTGQYLQGRPVSRDELSPGDVVVFENTYRAGISHVGIYIGQGRFIHASNSRSGVKISDLDSSYYASRYVGARRMF
jgi:cell wall-associated NlpC family hydrolase